jgi:hypothetical protein
MNWRELVGQLYRFLYEIVVVGGDRQQEVVVDW